MTERAYTVNEIDDLRWVVQTKWLFGRYDTHGYGGMSRPHNEIEKIKCVEELVRTWMLAGKTAEDLRASEEV